MQIIYEKNGKFYDMATREGREEILGKSQGSPVVMTDESGEIICAYTNPMDIEKNTALIKTIKEKFPGQPLRKAIDLFEQELLLKAKQEKAEMMLKSKQPAAVSKPKTSRPGWERIDAAMAKLDAMIARAG